MKWHGSVGTHEVVKISAQGKEPFADLLAVEEPLEIRLVYGWEDQRIEKSISVTMRTPGHDYELALGFLYTEAIIRQYGDVLSLRYCEQSSGKEDRENILKVTLNTNVTPDIEKLTRHFYTSSSCGVCGKSSIEAVQTTCSTIDSSFKIPERVIHTAPVSLREAQHVFEYTGGLHAAGLFDNTGSLLCMREDIGRHNAVDKVIGAALSQSLIPLSECMLMVSGRASFELVQKAALAGVPVLAAVSAPSSLAVHLAEEVGMTLIGFVRNGSFNIYTGRQRVI